MIERTFVMIKPDGVKRTLVGEIIKRFENVGLKLVGMKMTWIDRDFSKKHYSAHVQKPFYPGVEEFIISGPVIAMVFEGVHAIEVVRKIVGGTEPKSAIPGTIRGDYTHVSYSHADDKKMALRNVIHASGDKNDAEKEIALWFSGEELFKYKNVHEEHVF